MVHIRNLRRKVERDSKNPMIIKTSWGKGYYCVKKDTDKGERMEDSYAVDGSYSFDGAGKHFIV